MPKRAPLTLEEKKMIYFGKLAGRSLDELAQALDCSPACARKWWRIGRDGGLAALRADRPLQRKTGALARFDPLVAHRALHWKQTFPRRGPERILSLLADEHALAGMTLPARSTLAAFFKACCPELLQRRHRRPTAPPKARHVHQLWQLDTKENIRLGDGGTASVLTVREPVACVFLGLFAHETSTEKAWRKLTRHELQADLRSVFTDYGLPRGLQTDRERVFGRPGAEAFPTPLSLWFVGLGIEHHFSRPAQPTDQPQVERGHRTWHDWLYQAEPAADLEALQRSLEQARCVHNEVLCSRAGDCQGRVPYQAHPEVQTTHRAYDRGAELVLFSLARVDRYLAQFTWQHKVTRSGQVHVGESVYYAGTKYAGQQVHVRFEAQDRHFVFLDPQTEKTLKRQPAKGLDVASITGLDGAQAPPLSDPCQLSFVW